VVIASWCQGRDHVWPEISSLGEPNRAACGYATQVQQSSNRKKKPRTPLIPTHHPDWTRGRGGGNLTLMQRLPVQMMCWIFPGTSMDLNLAGRSGARCGTCRSPSASASTILASSPLFHLPPSSSPQSTTHLPLICNRNSICSSSCSP
jgi:hypothetical protein